MRVEGSNNLQMTQAETGMPTNAAPSPSGPVLELPSSHATSQPDAIV